MSAPRWADLDDDGPWPEPPEMPEPSSYTPPHKRRPRVAPKKLPTAKQEKEKEPK
jgi:hypothetical protein